MHSSTAMSQTPPGPAAQDHQRVWGNLAVGSSATQLSELIGKWFLGTDLPSSTVTMSGYPSFSISYSAGSAPLFGSNGPNISDINQGYLGDSPSNTLASSHQCSRRTETAHMASVFTSMARPTMSRSIIPWPMAPASSTARRTSGRGLRRKPTRSSKRGRLDLTHHPFCTRFSAGDVRITTRVNENDLGDALFSTLHEAGHAMYEQAVDVALDGTPLGQGVSAGVHESQSRLWENVVGRSRGFWEHFYPGLQRSFAEQLSGVPLAAFHRAINKVARSLIRTDADELTYNLHITLRFDLELKMLEGELRVRDLPAAWHAAMRADLGIAPADDRDGCLQDAHWYSGYIGGRFHSYAIGNILAAQFYAAALKSHPDIPHEIRKGAFATLHTWLRDKLYRHGSKFAPNDLVKRATGAVMQMRPYLDYLHEKYGALYRLPTSSD
jgi:Carboxypeptidase Taq (M32) metallopeptidase